MKTFLVTGANSGVGFEVARGLSAAGHTVLLAVRDEAKGSAARDELLRECPGADLRVVRVDLSDLSSVRSLAARDDVQPDVLINNAGIAFEPLRLTSEGVHAQLAANHLGHFVLTALLFERLSRVVTVTSTLAKRGRLQLQSFGGEHFSSVTAYGQSKLANVFFGAELDRRLRARGMNTRSVLSHPGLPATAMQQKAQGFIGLVARTAAALLGRHPAFGAKAVLEAALGDVAGGAMVGPGPRVEKTWPTMKDAQSARELWSWSEQVGGVRLL